MTVPLSLSRSPLLSVSLSLDSLLSHLSLLIIHHRSLSSSPHSLSLLSTTKSTSIETDPSSIIVSTTSFNTHQTPLSNPINLSYLHYCQKTYPTHTHTPHPEVAAEIRERERERVCQTSFTEAKEAIYQEVYQRPDRPEVNKRHKQTNKQKKEVPVRNSPYYVK